jgi:hypothetical protein
VLDATTGPHAEGEKFKQMIAKIKAHLACFNKTHFESYDLNE